MHGLWNLAFHQQLESEIQLPPSETGIQCLESGNHGVESECKTFLDSLTIEWNMRITFSPGHRVFVLLTSTLSSFFQLHLVVANSMLPVAMLIVCVICHKRSNGRPRGVYLILRVQEGSLIDGKQLKDRGVYSYKRKQLNKTNILLSKISRAFKNCGISSPYFWYI